MTGRETGFTMFGSRVGRRGFTLIEVLVASSILAILSGLVFAIAANMAELWKQSSQRLAARSTGELALDLLERDLGAIVFPGGEGNWLQIVLEVEAGADGLGGNPHLMFFSHQPGSDSVAAGTAAVSYRFDYRDPFVGSGNGKHRRTGLYRAVLDPEQTFRQVWLSLVQADLKALVWDRNDALPGGGAAEAWPADIRNWSLDTANLLATPVLSWGLNLHYLDGNGQAAVARLGPGSVHRLSAGAQLEIDGASVPYQRLVALDVGITVLSREGARRLDAFLHQASGVQAPADFLQTLAAQEGEIVTRRIAFLSTVR